ncbi:MAG TPA: 50S ribosomal protein L3 [Acidobacteriota bacterium]|nr:50S ribosomal protein L3 [Acidobacteriota bacterium]
MANIRQPRHGSMQFWPRVRAQSQTPRVRAYASSDKMKLLGFAGYKAGMTHVLYTDNQKNSPTKGQTVAAAATILEVPPLSVIAARIYKMTVNGLAVVKQINAKQTTDLAKRLTVSKKDATTFDGVDADFEELRLVVATSPKATGLSRKVPDIFEIEVGGKPADQLNFAKTHLGKTLSITDVFAAGDLVDAHAVTKGKGFQGPVKRFGVSIRRHKSEKAIRNPASLGPWCGQGHVMYRVAHAGKMGYHLRTEYNKKILLISEDASKINPKGGIVRYGLVKSTYVLIKGSIGGAKKRLVRLCIATRPNKKYVGEAPSLEHVGQEAQN